MKFKKLGFQTKEGLSLTDFQDGWSMEYGEGGSYHCNLTLNGKVVAEITEEGNGGPIDYRFNNDAVENETLDLIKNFLGRVDQDYKDVKNIKKGDSNDYLISGDCLVSCAIEQMLHRYDKVKVAKSAFKKGYKMVGIIEQDYQWSHLCTCTDNKEAVLAKLKTFDSAKNAKQLYVISPNDLVEAY